MFISSFLSLFCRLFPARGRIFPVYTILFAFPRVLTKHYADATLIHPLQHLRGGKFTPDYPTRLSRSANKNIGQRSGETLLQRFVVELGE